MDSFSTLVIIGINHHTLDVGSRSTVYGDSGGTWFESHLGKSHALKVWGIMAYIIRDCRYL